MNKYQKSMENITPPEGLEDRVVAAVRAESAGRGSRVSQRRLRPAAMLIAAAMALLLCIGAAASGIYYSLVILPGRGVVDVGDRVPLVLDEVIPFGERQIDYAVLNYGDTNELRVIVTDGSSDFDMHKLTGDIHGDFEVVRTNFYTGLNAEADGVSYSLAPIDEESGGEYSKFDVYVCSDFPDVRSFTLSAPTGESVELSLTEYSDANVIEHSFGPVTLRVLPMSKGSRYVFFDVENHALGDDWAAEMVPSITLIGENGEEGYITTYMGIYRSRSESDMYELVGRMESGMTGRIADFSFNDLSHPMNARLKNCQDYVSVSELSFALPSEGETAVPDEPIVLFDHGGFRIAASKVTMKDGKLEFTVTGDDIQSKPAGIELIHFYGCGTITDQDGRQLFRLSESGGQPINGGEEILTYEQTDESDASGSLFIKYKLDGISYKPIQE